MASDPTTEAAESVSVEYEHIAPEAFAQAQRIQGQLMLRNKSRKLWVWWAFLGALMVLLAVAIANTLMARWSTDWILWVGILLALLFGIYLYGVRASGRSLAESADGPLISEVGPDGLSCRDRVSESRFAWEAVDGLFRTETNLIFICKTIQFVAIPLAAFADEDHQERFVAMAQTQVPVETMTKASIRDERRQKHRTLNRVGWVGLALLGLIGVVYFLAPWRDRITVAEGDVMPYFEVITADAADTPDLPLVIGLHGWGSFPELMSMLFLRHLDTPARVVLPAGPHRWVIGHSWDDFNHEEDDWAEFVRQYREQADRIEALSRALQQKYPDAGKPAVTGFSQGATLTFTVAAYNGAEFSGAFPLAGSLPDELEAGITAHPLPVRAVIGAEDDIMSPEWAEDSVRQMQEAGFDAVLKMIPDLSHRLNAEARDYWAHELAHVLAPEEHSHQAKESGGSL